MATLPWSKLRLLPGRSGGRGRPMGGRGNTKNCDLKGCKHKHHANGLCKKHSEKMRITGTLSPIHHGTRAFVDAAIASDSDGCIIWPYRLSASGYGIVTHEGRRTPVHRVVLIKTK